MHATTVKNKITQRDNYKEIMSVIVVVLLLTLTLIAIFSAIDQLGISEMGRIVRIFMKGDHSITSIEIG
ncbi:two-component system connector SafA [Escherichia coli]|uniref:two-component system connector SafA n=1 Tax=Escherichia coli TaxID=562 RepID=UPI000BE5840D|nr:two-component system connector SafA [Escherichia coli]